MKEKGSSENEAIITKERTTGLREEWGRLYEGGPLIAKLESLIIVRTIKLKLISYKQK